MNNLIHLRQASKTFGQGATTHNVLKGIDLSIDAGEAVAIVGPSGGGKSTLLSILGLLDKTSGGEYQLKGQNVNALTRRQTSILRNRHIGWVFQNFSLIGSLSALENVALPLRYNPSIPPSDYARLSKQVLEQVGLADKLHLRPDALSGGQQQRVAVARALVNQPALLLADEPTGNLDSHAGEAVMQLLLECHQRGTTLLMVTHDNGLAKRCQRQIFLKDGRIFDAAD
ncbi:ABC transporter ATP-binding protein [Bowmanella denitrificans]|uniref:ABC transporter ATP-binding protein n=1 Tax=Bowmanella denitrificans TaxID=366582 RepID=UPI001C0EFBA5|nr:ABC transporter ATP-binding protein [Bowmanella denitrificans]